QRAADRRGERQGPLEGRRSAREQARALYVQQVPAGRREALARRAAAALRPCGLRGAAQREDRLSLALGFQGWLLRLTLSSRCNIFSPTPRRRRAARTTLLCALSRRR